MKIERICTFEENELNAIKTIARINCDGISCDECPLNDTLRKMCTRALCRQVLEHQNIDY